ncbi:MAG TPA: hypothetical protein VMA36_14710 [Candidatus Limnocylindria bacterium]|jgi:hypothetical protein|nr:hypothetical protein [Candidatus Limnocylindria bacterium]
MAGTPTRAGSSTAAVALIVLAGALAPSPALALGTVRIQQSDASVQNYPDVTMRLTDAALLLTSADRVSTLLVSRTNCVPDGTLVRCSPTRVVLQKGGKSYPIDMASATLYLNLRDTDEPLSFSSLRLAPSSVLLTIRTHKGTYITGSGRFAGSQTP